MCGRIEFYPTRAAGVRLIVWIDARLPAPERDIDPGELLLAGCGELDQGWLRIQHQLDELHVWVCDVVPEYSIADPHIVVCETFLAPGGQHKDGSRAGTRLVKDQRLFPVGERSGGAFGLEGVCHRAPGSRPPQLLECLSGWNPARLR